MKAESDRSATVDLALGQRGSEADAFERWLAEACRLRGLSYRRIDGDIVPGALDAICRGRLRVRMLLDLTACWGRDDDPYVRLCHVVKDSGGAVIDDPDTAAVADHKVITHHALERAGLPVPPTVMFRRWADDRELTEDERRRLGERVVIKPARGWGGKGVVLAAGPDRRMLSGARDYDRSDDFLVQRHVPHARLRDDAGVDRAAWWRVYHLFGEIIPCWWGPDDGRYRHVSLRELWMHGLLPLVRLTAEIARITRMDFFSTEICLADEPADTASPFRIGDRRLYVIDYVNDQCDLKVRSRHPSSPPDHLVRHLADRFAELAWRHRHGLPLDGHRSLWLRRAPGHDRTV
ncbi:MAG: ATP-grasp domain-containing protein [Gemmatimonadota bacterium]